MLGGRWVVAHAQALLERRPHGATQRTSSSWPSRPRFATHASPLPTPAATLPAHRASSGPRPHQVAPGHTPPTRILLRGAAGIRRTGTAH